MRFCNPDCLIEWRPVEPPFEVVPNPKWWR